METQTIAKLIREIRDQNYLTLEALGRILDVSFATVSHWEHGRRTPHNKYLLLIKEKFPKEWSKYVREGADDRVV